MLEWICEESLLESVNDVIVVKQQPWLVLYSETPTYCTHLLSSVSPTAFTTFNGQRISEPKLGISRSGISCAMHSACKRGALSWHGGEKKGRRVEG